MRTFHDGRDVFFERRFGMFVHWGLYSIPAWHEQILWRGGWKRHDYEQLMHQFNPVAFDPDQWLDAAEEAGMQYIIFTTKHHDGFCMWDTAHTSYKVTNTPYGLDVLDKLARACQRRGFPLSLYYSCPDWHHKHYPNKGRHHEMFGPRPGDEPDLDKYYEYVRNQVTELCTRYGPLYQFFWDVNVAGYQDASLNRLIRDLQPGILINDRGPDAGDYGTPERSVPDGAVFEVPTEACQALGKESWGYKEDEDYHSIKFIMQSIDKILAMGGNYSLNVGPKSDGTFPQKDQEMLRTIGNWYRRVRESFTGTEPCTDLVKLTPQWHGEPTAQRGFLLTKWDHVVYAHLFRDPETSAMCLNPLDLMPKEVTLLNDGRALEARVDVTPSHWREKPLLRIRNLPVDEMNHEVMVLRLVFDSNLSE